LWGGGGIDTGATQSRQVIVAPGRTDEVNGFVAAVEAVFDKRHQHAVLFLAAVEKGTHVTAVIQKGAGEPHWTRRFGRIHTKLHTRRRS
jgi:hypothetical protein